MDGYTLGDLRISTAMLRRVQARDDTLLQRLKQKYLRRPNTTKRDVDSFDESDIDFILQKLPKELQKIDKKLLLYLLVEARAEIAHKGNRQESKISKWTVSQKLL